MLTIFVYGVTVLGSILSTKGINMYQIHHAKHFYAVTTPATDKYGRKFDKLVYFVGAEWCWCHPSYEPSVSDKMETL